MAEGYAPAMPGVEPAVVSFTSWVAAVAVSELLERLIHTARDRFLTRSHSSTRP